jgi:hypothetical protein
VCAYRYLVQCWRGHVSFLSWGTEETTKPELTSQLLPAQRPVLNHEPLSRCNWMPQSLTFEQQPPNISASMPPTASHCGIVSMMMRPTSAMIRDDAGRGSSIPYISAFSREGAALMTLGTMMSPSDTADAWRSLRIARRRGVGMEVGGALLESVLRFLAIQACGGG